MYLCESLDMSSSGLLSPVVSHVGNFQLDTSTVLKKFIDVSSNHKKYEQCASIIGSMLMMKKKEEVDDVYIWE
ncbi:hypothetical protein A0H81_08724 [Grifola frondosa]|uniref:Uncharacterized protein n=1 Tax=Grifola frondosa TaxID=5627 RepID=A0A1C7M3J8_GRIFR|nr:hypothetical protein A0H81_08724 [Grifola frondosa]